MKRVFIVIMILAGSIKCFSQDPIITKIFPLKDGYVYFEKIVEDDSSSKIIFSRRVKTWLRANESSINSKVYSDKETGIVLCNIFFTQPYTWPKEKPYNGISTDWKYNCILAFKIQDGAVKISIDSIKITVDSSMNPQRIELITAAAKQKKKKYASIILEANENLVISLTAAKNTIEELLENISVSLLNDDF